MRGYIRKRGDTYWVTVSAGTDPTTKKRQQIYRSARSEDEAERVLTEELRALDTGSYTDPGKTTLAGYLRGRWLPHMRSRVRPTTHLRYAQLLEGHVIPHIGSVRLARLRPMHVQGVVDAALAAGRAPRTVASVYRTLHSALRQGVRWQILSTNAAAAVQPPRAERPRISIPDPETVARLLAASSARMRVPLVLAATTGARRGEVLAMRWRYVDLTAGLARVVASLQDVGGELRFMDTKTDRSRRTIALAPAAVAVLRQHRKDQAERRLLLGAAWADMDMVIDRGDGQPLPPDAVSRAFYRLTREIGRPDLRLHDLRHAYATTLLAGGVHPKIVSEALGHSSVGFTLDVYSHVVPTMQEQAAAAIEAALGSVIQESAVGRVWAESGAD